MNLLPSDYANLKDAIDSVLMAHPNAASEYRKVGKSHIAFRWDVLFASGHKTGRPYLDDSIDAALVRIIGNDYD